MKSIVEKLNQYHQRATYGAVGDLLHEAPRFVMNPYPRDWKHSWVVNEETGEPSRYPALKKHPALHERSAILRTKSELEAWLANPT